MTNKSDKILAPIKQRIIQVIDSKVTNKKVFFAENNLSSSNFRGPALFSEVSGEVVAKILTLFPDIDANWMILGFRKEKHEDSSLLIDEPNPIRDKLITRQDQLIEHLEHQNKELKLQILQLKKAKESASYPGMVAEPVQKLEEKAKK